MNDNDVVLNNEVGAVIITFNPDDNFGENLFAITKQLENIIIVDNGSNLDTLGIIKDCIQSNDKIKLIENGYNLGIAKALNIGCQLLFESNVSYSLLLDQDSFVTQGMVDSLHNTISKENKCAVVGPCILNSISDDSNKVLPSSYMIPSYGFFYKKSFISNKPLQVLFNITSGSLVDLRIWNEIGKFQEDYFIEGVDNEYGLRANDMGYKVLIDNKASLIQQYGNQRIFSMFGKDFFPTFHSPLRHFYVSRNRVMIWKRYYKVFPYYLTWDLLSFFNTLFLIVAFEDNKFKKLIFILKGYCAGFRGLKGKYS